MYGSARRAGPAAILPSPAGLRSPGGADGRGRLVGESACRARGPHVWVRPLRAVLGRGARRAARLDGLDLVGLEADLQHAVAQRVPVERLDGHHGLVVVGHGDEAVALALVGLQVADDLDALHGAEGPEQLPQHVLLGLGRQVVHEDAPLGAHGARQHAAQQLAGQRAVPLQPLVDGQQRLARAEAAQRRREAQRGRQVRGQRRQRLAVVGRVVGELDRDGLRGALGHGAVELLDGALGLHALVEADEAHALGQPLLAAREGPAARVLAQDARRDDAAVGAEQPLQLALGHGLGQPGHVQVSALDGLAAGPRVRHLDGLVLQAQPVERGDGLLGVLGPVVVDEGVAQRLAAAVQRVVERVGEGGALVADQLAALHLADAGEQAADLLLRHALRQVVDDQVGLGLLAGAVLLLALALRHGSNHKRKERKGN